MGGYIEYKPDFLSKSEADTLLSVVQNAKSWARQPIRLFGKDIMEPRDVILFGTAPYTYSSMKRTPIGWNDDLPSSDRVYSLGCRIEDHLGIERDFFNTVLANKYYHGRDFMGWHADDEVALGAHPLIAAVSVGAERRFVVRRKKNKTMKVAAKKSTANSDGDVNADGMKQKEEEEEGFEEDWDRMEYVLGHGSLLVMSGNMQEYYQHCVPKTALSKCNELRINLSFRRVV